MRVNVYAEEMTERVEIISKEIDGHAYPWKGPLSYTLLKMIASSPAEFRYACQAPLEPSAAMRLGTVVHWHTLGGPEERRPLVYEASKTKGEGAVKAWRAFQEAHAGETIYSLEEWCEGQEVAHQLRHAPHNRARFDAWIQGGQYETPMAGEIGGFAFATRGIDVLRPTADGHSLVDLKKARTVEREPLQRQARSLHYPEQLAIYRTLARQNGFTVTDCAVFAVCPAPPVLTRVLRFSEGHLARAVANVETWLQTLRVCLETDVWPGGGEDDYEDWGAPMTGESELETESA